MASGEVHRPAGPRNRWPTTLLPPSAPGAHALAHLRQPRGLHLVPPLPGSPPCHGFTHLLFLGLARCPPDVPLAPSSCPSGRCSDSVASERKKRPLLFLRRCHWPALRARPCTASLRRTSANPRRRLFVSVSPAVVPAPARVRCLMSVYGTTESMNETKLLNKYIGSGVWTD